MVNRKTIGFILYSVLIGVLAALLILFLQMIPHDRQDSRVRVPQDQEQIAVLNNTDRLLSMQQTVSYNSAVSIAAPAVVNVYGAKFQQQQIHPLFQDPTFKRFFGDTPSTPSTQPNSNLGSGVILDSAGYVLTNAHVIKNADRITITIQDGRQANARIIGTDSDTDLAVLKIDLDNLPVIPIGDSSELLVGDVVLAIGNPYNFGQTVTQGIISATGRRSLGISTFEDFIQTDASINPGNSGGALIDAHGRLLGINTAIISSTGGSQGIGLATPINLALDVMWQLIAYGKVVRGWLGIEAQVISPKIRNQMRLSKGGVMIAGIMQNGPAHKAGLIPGDIITAINGKALTNPQQAIYLISQIKPGKVVSLTVIRAWDELTIKATVAQRPQFKS